ncbi:hypothetical protein PALB_14020 [Pseudoalteromonas luteoviolacea B = ATCC 29581]|nr:hypothetical protein PALB_14020 [Pseudoalteromonas luteoviolacea B = ATCC 29581]
MPRITFIALFLSLTLHVNAVATDTTEFKRVGNEATYSYLFWDVYTAELFAPSGQFDKSKPFRLKLTYHLDLKGKEIAKRSIQEMKEQGLNDEAKQAQWLALMVNIFPDIRKGDSLIGSRELNGATLFRYNGQEVGKIDDADFTLWFFDIWLGEKTTAPDTRRELLGLNKKSSKEVK